MPAAITSESRESSVGDASIAQKGRNFDKHRQGVICIFPSPAHGNAESARENWIRTRRLIASLIPDLQRDLGGSK
jgi:hypothetical protein